MKAFNTSSQGQPHARSFDFPGLDRVVHGAGSVGIIADEVDRLGGRKVFIVTGRTIANKTDYLDRLRAELGDRVVGCYTEMPAHTPQARVLIAAEAAKRCEADMLVSLGGGSAVDGAKMVALCLAEGIERDEDFAPYRMSLVDGVPVAATTSGRGIAHVAIPTTLSGAELSGFAGCTDAVSGKKAQYKHPDLAPKIIIQDPELAKATPAWLWGSTGLRAVDHCVEALYSTSQHPFADALSVEALGLLSSELVAATADPDNLVGRERCQVASWLSLYSLGNVMVGLSHAIGHQLGGRCGVPHGVTSCLMLAAVMDFNRPACADRLAKAGRAMGVGGHVADNEEAAQAASDRVRSLVRELGIKDRLQDWGVAEDDIGPIAKGTMEEFLLATNPRHVTKAADVESLLRQVF